MSSMRVNPNLYLDALNALSLSQNNEDQAMRQLSSGLRVNSPSDDPAAAAENVGILAQMSANDTFQRNISSISGSLQTADSALNSAVNLLTQAISIGVQGGNSDLTSANRQQLAQEVQGIQSELMNVANTSSQGNYLFAGTATATQPYTSTPDPTDASNAPVVTYNGDGNSDEAEIGNGQYVQMNLPGSQLFSGPNSAFGALKQLSDAIQNNGDVSGAVSSLQAAFQYVTGQRTFYGNALQQVQSTESFLNSDKVELTSEQNNLVGVDEDQAVTNLQQAEVARQAALAASSQINQNSLLDYLK
jgi:flagellar hook-associated protein 3 FlgL